MRSTGRFPAMALVRYRTLFTVCTSFPIETTVQVVSSLSPALSSTIWISPATRQGTAGSSMSLKILIVDDSLSIRHLLRCLIEKNTDWEVCGEAENGQIAVKKVAELRPHAVILDLSMPVMNGLEAAREISRIAPNVEMVMFTMHTSEQLQKDACAAGIKDVISKSGAIGDHLLASLRSICARRFADTSGQDPESAEVTPWRARH